MGFLRPDLFFLLAAPPGLTHHSVCDCGPPLRSGAGVEYGFITSLFALHFSPIYGPGWELKKRSCSFPEQGSRVVLVRFPALAVGPLVRAGCQPGSVSLWKGSCLRAVPGPAHSRP